MHSAFHNFLIAVTVLAAATTTAVAQAPASPMPVDNDLPQPISEQDTAELLMHSPFTRNLNLEDSLQLTGVAYVEGKPVATVYNRDTRQSFVVSDQPNASGWTLKDVAPSTDLKTAHVTMMIGPEEIRLAYGNEQITPGAAKKGVPTANMARTDLPSGQMPMVAHNRGGDSNHMTPSGKIRTSSYLGENGREMYASLSDKARDKFKEVVRARFEQKPDMTEEQRNAYAQKVFKSIKDSDTKATTNAGNDRKPDRRSR
ncbi:hypothetical protein DES53_104208 [Roseimicrobium gellanilyticum]|uniref:Secreted protein n=1 Tax=Roseimicrobium gellanilyticum TaxID=748857 RepID=A0A366HML0_9BACT|nr:hypothetical protein [Roseimicrobium gellanilyticum]RBP44388.1 hypothetical protein DES53_104208 [Roseimicrobium gellanilyticum]